MINWRKKISSAHIDEENDMATAHFWDGSSVCGRIEEIKEYCGHYPLKVEKFSVHALFAEIERLNKEVERLELEIMKVPEES